MSDIVTLLKDTSVTIVILAYFIYRDIKWMSSLQTTLVTLVDAVNTLKEMTKGDIKHDE